MEKIQVWSEGYAATGERAPAQFMGEYEADNFDNAVTLMLRHYEDSDKWKDIKKNYSYRANRDGVMCHALWGCVLYDNETDARQYFG